MRQRRSIETLTRVYYSIHLTEGKWRVRYRDKKSGKIRSFTAPHIACARSKGEAQERLERMVAPEARKFLELQSAGVGLHDLSAKGLYRIAARRKKLKSEIADLERIKAELNSTIEELHLPAWRARVKLCEEQRIVQTGEAALSAAMPPIPLSHRTPVFKCHLPDAPGIYFLFSDSTSKSVAYVGQARSLSARVTGSHHKAKQSDFVSWLSFDPSELFWAECYYIWLCRPFRNGRVPAGLL